MMHSFCFSLRGGGGEGKGWRRGVGKGWVGSF